MDTDSKKESQRAVAIEQKAMDPKRAEKELKFVLHCLVSSLDNGGKMNTESIAEKFGIQPKGASDKLWRIRYRYGLTKNQIAEQKKALKIHKPDGGDGDGRKVDGEEKRRQKQGIQEQEQKEEEHEHEQESDFQECDPDDSEGFNSDDACA